MVGVHVSVGKSRERLRENSVRVDVVEVDESRRARWFVGIAVGVGVLMGVMAVEVAVSSGMAWTV
jgi:hypothetical protein